MSLRLEVARLRNRLDLVTSSYYLEHQVGYATLMEHPELLNDLQYDAFDWNCRFFTRHAKNFISFPLDFVSLSGGPLDFLRHPRFRPLLRSLHKLRGKPLEQLPLLAHLHSSDSFASVELRRALDALNAFWL